MTNIDSQLEDAITDAVGRYELEMVERFDTDGDPSLTDREVWVAQVSAACDELNCDLRTEIESAFKRVNTALDNGEFADSEGVHQVLQHRRRKLVLREDEEVTKSMPGIIPLTEMCKTVG